MLSAVRGTCGCVATHGKPLARARAPLALPARRCGLEQMLNQHGESTPETACGWQRA